MAKKVNSGWTVEGAVSLINSAPMFGGVGFDSVFAPDPRDVRNAWEFLRSEYNEEEINRMVSWGKDRMEGKPLREF